MTVLGYRFGEVDMTHRNRFWSLGRTAAYDRELALDSRPGFGLASIFVVDARANGQVIARGWLPGDPSHTRRGAASGNGSGTRTISVYF